MKTEKDSIYATPRGKVGAFVFDEQVVSVFPDMIQRSVPGYSHVIAMLGLFAARYAQPHSRCYDLGCSLGAATLALRRGLQQPDCRIVAVDNSAAMVERCQQVIDAAGAGAPVELICDDIREVAIERASIVVLNFTLQFIDPEDRLALLQRIYQGLLPGGVLVLSEKITFEDAEQQLDFTELHHDFKRANGYSELEISQKRTALENVLRPDSVPAHQARLREAGFRRADQWFQSFNFVSILAQK